MTVAELIKELESMNPDTLVLVKGSYNGSYDPNVVLDQLNVVCLEKIDPIEYVYSKNGQPAVVLV